jgi:3-oxoacyl-[acyl-carrier protein] reductase
LEGDGPTGAFRNVGTQLAIINAQKGLQAFILKKGVCRVGRFENKVAIITGGARGIGLATAKKMAADGAKIILVDINEAQLQEAAGCIEAPQVSVMTCVCDITDPQQVEKLAELVIKECGQIDILVNNAGITRDAMSDKMTDLQWNQVINTNLTGAFNMCRAVIPYMKARKYGRIVSLASVSAYGNVGQVNYAASKAGIIGMTRTLALELGRYNITVNAVLPGLTATEMMKTIPEHVLDTWEKKIPMRRLGQPEEQADAISFLASDAASYISGVELPVAGAALII